MLTFHLLSWVPTHRLTRSFQYRYIEQLHCDHEDGDLTNRNCGSFEACGKTSEPSTWSLSIWGNAFDSRNGRCRSSSGCIGPLQPEDHRHSACLVNPRRTDNANDNKIKPFSVSTVHSVPTGRFADSW
jgi:hypothetical protein